MAVKENFVVLKFGGSSVSTVERWKTIANIAKQRLDDGVRPVLVCSALSTISDKLEQLLEASLRGHHDEILSQIKNQHITLIKSLGLEKKSENGNGSENLKQLYEIFEEIKQLSLGISLVGEVSPRVRARVMAYGELMSTQIGAAFLNHQGLDTVRLDARDFLIACPESNATEARMLLTAICDDSPDPEIVEKFRAIKNDVVITQGFIARNGQCDTVLLGRGGSDTSAAYIAAKISARELEIWTDVSGIYSANPREIPTARLLRQLDYDEAQEIASCGAKVLHPRCIGPCRKNKIPLTIHCINHPHVQGTLISEELENQTAEVKAIAKQTGVVLISMDTMGMWQQVGFLADIFAIFKNEGISIDLVSTSESNVTVSLDSASASIDREKIDSLVQALSQKCLTRVIGPTAEISLVGKNIRTILHRLGPALEVFEEKRIHLLSQAASDLNLTFVVDEDMADRLVAQLHTMLFEDSQLGPTWKEIFADEEEPSWTHLPWWYTRRENLIHLAREKTPLFVYDIETLQRGAQQLKALESVDRVFYSIKANSHPVIIQLFEKMGVGFECVSIGEVNHLFALIPHLSPDRVLFTPNFAPRREYEEAFERGVHVTIDCLHGLLEWKEVFKDKDIFVRLDPGQGRGHHSHVKTAGSRSKFGITLDKIENLIECSEQVRARIVGLHAHRGSGIRTADNWSEIAVILSEIAQRIGTVNILDLGGGLGVPEKAGQSPLDLQAMDESLAKVKAAYPGTEFWLEPGRFLVAQAGVLLSTVTQLKQKSGADYIGVDVGMNTLIRPALYGSFHEIINLSRIEEPRNQCAHIVGPICETGDTLGYRRQIAPTREGDIVLIATTGAYGRAMSSSYNLRQPAEESFIDIES